ncbi:hypothetical protein P6709_14710 [Jeotgalibacillus sp. ET6]|uniref:UPF0738 family protein n=1 Tax=Jeotgalibacillus sp. ET6 TaxID=3037260 RepID=UPI00241839D3|nr:hypothetical protein [Jeotgalibacillus sp. ET6]MDG5473003.1 hypothetical protein [Jeotgalibacillus sp. ET6]
MSRKKVWLNQAAEINSELILKGEQTDEIGKLEPAGQVIVDSEELAFVYLAEEKSEYTYLYLPDFLWPEIIEAINKKQVIKVHIGENEMELKQLEDELNDLVMNIEGNSNYGDAFVEKVESVFIKK